MCIGVKIVRVIAERRDLDVLALEIRLNGLDLLIADLVGIEGGLRPGRQLHALKAHLVSKCCRLLAVVRVKAQTHSDISLLLQS